MSSFNFRPQSFRSSLWGNPPPYPGPLTEHLPGRNELMRRASTMSSSMTALVVGVDSYPYNKKYPNLKGCVADAKAMVKFLCEELHVPMRNIRCLLDQQATRSAIMAELRTLTQVPSANFERDSPILIFFAGHGGLCEAPPGYGYQPNERIQMLIPHDCGGMDREHGKVTGIPDYTIASMLNQIAMKRGDNVLVILDTCYSGSGTRAVGETYATRGVKYCDGLPSLSLEVPGHAGGCSRGFEAARDSAYSGLRSHVLLAACNSHESAREVDKRGVFSKALLQVMHSLGPDGIFNITYRDLMNKIPLLPLNQNPQCEGFNQDRLLFQCQEYNRVNALCKGVVSPQGEHLFMHDASLHPGDEVAIWEHNNYQRGPPKGTTKVCNINGATAMAENTVRLPPNTHFLYKVEQTTHCMNIPIHVGAAPSQRVIQHALKAVLQEQNGSHTKFNMKEQADMAGISVVQNESGYSVSNNDAEFNQLGMKTLPYVIPPTASQPAFENFFRGVAAYQHHLREKRPSPTKVSLRLYRVERDNQFVGENLNVKGVGIHLVDDGSSFAIVIKNDMNVDLYPALFYFNNCDFSIQRLYIPPSAGRHTAEAPLKKNHHLVINHPSTGLHPFVSKVRSPHPIECGYLKLFVSNCTVDFSLIEQKSPFTHFAPVRHDRARELADPPQLSSRNYTGSLLIPFVVRPKNDRAGQRGIDPESSGGSRAYNPWAKVFQRADKTYVAAGSGDAQGITERFSSLDIKASSAVPASEVARPTPRSNWNPAEALKVLDQIDRDLDELNKELENLNDWRNKTGKDWDQLRSKAGTVRSMTEQQGQYTFARRSRSTYM